MPEVSSPAQVTKLLITLALKLLRRELKLLSKQANIIVLCSADDEYTITAPAANTSTGKAILVVAGYPKESIGELKKKD